MILLRKMKLPEEIQWTSFTAHHKLGPTPDRAHAVQLPVVHLGLDVRLLQFCLKSKLCTVALTAGSDQVMIIYFHQTS